MIDFDNIQVLLRLFSLNLNAYKVMKAFLIFCRPNFEEDHHIFAGIEIMRFRLNSLNQACISSKLIMQLTKTNFSDSVIFIEKKSVENWLWAKVNFVGKKK